MTSRRGLALVLVVGVLGVLAVLGAAFAVLSRLERRAAAQRVHATRAYLLARSGLEQAMASLDAGQEADYRGEDWNANGILDTLEVAAQAYHVTALGTPADRDSCPVRHALRPSYYVQDRLSPSDPKPPTLVLVDGRTRGYSGRLTSDRMAWSLKVESQGKLFVNGGDPALPPTMGYNAVLKRVLGLLAQTLDREDCNPPVPPGWHLGVAGTDNHPVSKTDGENLISLRPSSGWRSFEQVRDVALGSSQSKLDALKPYLTLKAWTDRHVVRPNPAPSMTGYITWADFKRAHPSALSGLSAPDFERMPPSAGGRIVGRAPVDFQWARSRRPVLIALLGDLSASYLDRSFRPLLAGGHPIGLTRESRLTIGGSVPYVPDQIADRILASTRELRTWAEWETFSSDLSASQTARDILKANFNPNTDLVKFNPDASRYRLLDKSDLLQYSTEFDLQGGSNGYGVESVGRVLSAEGRVLAIRTLSATRSGDRTARLDTQREFLCEDLGSLDVPGDEGETRLPGFRRAGAPGLFSESRGAGRTWGHRVDMTARYPGTWMDGDSRGSSLQSYPEPLADNRLSAGPNLRPADYDGSLRLATVETADDECYSVTAATQDMKMLARWDTGLDLSVADGGERRNLTDAQQVTTAEMGNSLLDAAKPNTLYPDGCYSEYQRIPAYPDRGSANGRHGVISFWFKADDYYQNRRWRTFVKWTNFREITNMIQIGTCPNQFFFLGWAGWDWKTGTNWVTGPFCQFESWQGLDIGHEFQLHTEGEQSPGTGQWRLMTLYYDFEAPTHHTCGELVLDAGGTPRTQASDDGYSFSCDRTATIDITEPDILGPHRIALGARRGVYDGATWNANGSQGSADATFDEFAIYDFGQDEGTASVLAANRFKEGRYYKGAAYGSLTDYAPADDQAPGYFTAPIRLPAGALLRRVHWTWHRPAALPDDYAEIELAQEDGSRYLGTPAPDGDAGSRSTRARGWTKDLQRWDPARRVDGPFRVHVVFRRVTPVDADTPILDTPVLDDLTLRYAPSGHPTFSEWGEGK